MEPLVLSRPLELEKYEVVMEIGRQQRREELHAVLMLAEGHGGQATARQVSQELLLGRPELAGKAIIDRCRDLDLLDEEGRISPVGRDALSTGSVFVPERGRYVVWFTDDPLVPQKLVHIEAMDEPRLGDEVAAIRSRNAGGGGKGEAEPIPRGLRALVGGPYDLMGKGGGRVVVRSIEPKGIKSTPRPEESTRLSLRISPESARLSASGGFERILPPPSLDYQESWSSALGPLARLWARSRDPPALRSGFDELGPKELASFNRTVRLARPALKVYGEFEDASVDGVPVFPKTALDATRWARWLLKDSIAGYLDAEQYSALAEKCRSRFPDFPGVRLPGREELAAELAAEAKADGALPRVYWHVQAPLDLQAKRP